MTLLQKINNLTWWNEPNKLKDILKLLIGNLFIDAPSDGEQYVRKDGEWEIVSGVGTGTGTAYLESIEIV